MHRGRWRVSTVWRWATDMYVRLNWRNMWRQLLLRSRLLRRWSARFQQVLWQTSVRFEIRLIAVNYITILRKFFCKFFFQMTVNLKKLWWLIGNGVGHINKVNCRQAAQLVSGLAVADPEILIEGTEDTRQCISPVVIYHKCTQRTICR